MGKKNEEIVIKRFLKISQKKLKSLGWEDSGKFFSEGKIFKKGKDFCFWEPKTKSIGCVSMSTHV